MRTPELEAAFLSTTYRVVTPEGRFDLRIGVPDPAFADFLSRQNATSWGIITACNPDGVLTLPQNAERSCALLARIKALGWRYFGADNCADSGEWPVEPAFCVLDAGEAALRRLAAEFGQAAIVCAQAGQDGGHLVWLSSPAGQ
jgi:hypothetical protein